MKYNIEAIARCFLQALPFPPILYKVVSMVRDQKEPLYKLGQEIAKDPVLSAKILETANSPFFGVKQKISDLPHAIALLGYKDVSMIIMRFALKKTFSCVEGLKKSRLYPAKQIWLHSLKSAFISKALAQNYNFPYPLECYIAGLLQDVGKNAIAISLQKGDELKTLREINTGKELHEAEREIIGFDHMQCSIHILKQMKISLEVLQAVKKHHEKMAKNFREMSFILALSNILAIYDITIDSESRELDEKLTDRFEIISPEIKGLDKIYNDLKNSLRDL